MRERNLGRDFTVLVLGTNGDTNPTKININELKLIQKTK